MLLKSSLRSPKAISLIAHKIERGKRAAQIVCHYLVEVQVIPWQQFLQKLPLFMHHRLNNKLVIICQVEYAPGSSGVGQFA